MEQIIADKIFDFAKAFGEDVALFTQEGESTLDAEMAKRFYLKDSKIMIHYDTSESKSEIRVSYGGERPIQEFKKLFVEKSLNAISAVSLHLHHSLDKTLSILTLLFIKNFPIYSACLCPSLFKFL